jgi:hypothetical protein
MEKSSTNGEQSWVLYKKYMVISTCLLSKFVLLTLKLPNAFELVKFEGLWQQFATFVNDILIYIGKPVPLQTVKPERLWPNSYCYG